MQKSRRPVEGHGSFFAEHPLNLRLSTQLFRARIYRKMGLQLVKVMLVVTLKFD